MSGPDLEAIEAALGKGIPAYDVTADGLELYDIDAAETTMAMGADAIRALRTERDRAHKVIVSAWNSFGGVVADDIDDVPYVIHVADGDLAEQIQALTKQRDAAEARTTALEADVALLTAERDTARHAALEECVKLAEATVNRYYEGQSVIDVRFSNIRGPKWADGKAIADAIRAIAGVRA